MTDCEQQHNRHVGCHVGCHDGTGISRPGVVGRAFTLIELLMILGVVSILLALILPALGSSWDLAQRTRDLGQLRSNVTLIGNYTNDYRDIYPIAFEGAGPSATQWHVALLDGGYISSEVEADPIGKSRYDNVRFWMSKCMVFSPRLMLPGATIPVDDQMSVAVKVHQVTYPSAKGLMYQWSSDAPLHGRNYFCCVMNWKAPVGFADGSGEFGSYLDYNAGTRPVIVDTIGIPVFTTWGGYLARDR